MTALRLLACLCCFLAPALAAVQGRVVNATTGQPQSGVAVNLVQPGAGGMQQLGSTTSGADGSFRFDQTPAAGGPVLLQANYQEVTYTQVVPPGSATTGLSVNVYESTAEPPAELRVQHLILLEPGAETLQVTETFLAQNSSRLTYYDARNGTLRFYLPAGVPDNLQITINATGVDVRRPVEQARGGLYRVDYPVRPGDTRYDLQYSLPASATFSGKVLSNDPPVRLVTPAGVTLSGTGVRDVGVEPTVQARIYELTEPSFTVKIQGVGTLRSPAAAPPEETGAPQCCQEAPPQIYSQMPWVLGFGLAILALGGILLYRRGSAVRA